MTRERISFTFDPKVVPSSNWLQLCKSCSGLHSLSENLRLWVMIWNDCSGALTKACYITQLLPFYLDVPLDGIGAVCHQFDLLSTDPSYTLCWLYWDFQLGFLVPALLQLQHLYILGKLQINIISAAYANLSIMFFQSISYDQFNIMLKRVGDRTHPFLTLFWTIFPWN